MVIRENYTTEPPYGRYVAMKEILKVICLAIAITTDLNSIGYVCINYFAISVIRLGSHTDNLLFAVV